MTAPTPAPHGTMVLYNEGQRLLLEVPGAVSELAATLEVRSLETIVFWRRGSRVPGPHLRVKLHKVYGIPTIAWDQPPKREGLAERAVSTDDSVTPGAVLLPLKAPALPTPIAHCLELLAAVRSERAATSRPADRLKLTQTESRILELRAKLEAQHELTEPRYVRDHPAWKRARAAIVDALREHPAAIKAVLHALERSGI